MKDLLFSGETIDAAVGQACELLGVGRGNLKYVVLSPGGASGFGTAPRPAQIAVFVEAENESPRTGGAGVVSRPGVREIVDLFLEAADLDVQVAWLEDDERWEAELSGADLPFLLEDEAETIEALEMLLQRVAQHQGLPRVSVVCPGLRGPRERALRSKAQSLAAEVQRDGQARTTEPLNSYERRIVHMVVSELPGVRTFSVGEGADRCVTIALANEPEAKQE